MTKNSEDLRITRTKKHIIEAFTHLLMKKEFSAITVRELTNNANINRGTFYLHYLDKYDLLEKCEEEIFKKIEEISYKETFSADLKYAFSFNQAPSFTIQVLEYFKENRLLINAMLSPNGNPSFEENLRKILSEFLFKNISHIIDISNLAYPLEILAAYTSSAHIGVIRYWLNNGTKQTPEEIVTMLFDIASKGALEASGIKNNLT